MRCGDVPARLDNCISLTTVPEPPVISYCAMHHRLSWLFPSPSHQCHDTSTPPGRVCSCTWLHPLFHLGLHPCASSLLGPRTTCLLRSLPRNSPLSLSAHLSLPLPAFSPSNPSLSHTPTPAPHPPPRLLAVCLLCVPCVRSLSLKQRRPSSPQCSPARRRASAR